VNDPWCFPLLLVHGLCGSITLPGTGEAGKQPDEQPGLSTSIKVGTIAAIVGIFLGLSGGLGIYLLQRKRSKRRTLNLPTNADAGAKYYLQSTGAPNGEYISMFALSDSIHSISSHFYTCG
jgi:hypothetical protein